ncbi:MAG: hypothetical protein ACK4TP_05530 [Hyphomicrobium sp.]|jgi:hypothetical protein
MTAADFPATFGDASLTSRYILAVVNSLMATVVGTLTLGIGVGIAGALVMAALPFAPVIRPAVVEWVKENPPGAALGAFLLSWIGGTIVWGLWFAFGVALFLVPVMLGIVVYLTLGKPIPAGSH